MRSAAFYCFGGTFKISRNITARRSAAFFKFEKNLSFECDKIYSENRQEAISAMSYYVGNSYNYNGCSDSDADEVIRKCLKSDSEAEITDALNKFSAAFRHKSFSETTIFSGIILQAILLEKSKAIRDSALPMLIETMSTAYTYDYNITQCLQNDLLFLLTRECISEGADLNEEYCKYLIDSYISNDSKFVIRWDHDVTDEPLIKSPLYTLMITEKYSLIRYYLKRLEAELSPDKRLGALAGYVQSAIRYKQDKFIRILIDEGYFIQRDEPALAYIFSEEGALDFITGIIPLSEPADTLAELESRYNEEGAYRFCILRNRQLSLAHLIYRQYGIEGVNRFCEKVPKTSVVYEMDMYSLIVDFLSNSGKHDSDDYDDLFILPCSDSRDIEEERSAHEPSPIRSAKDIINLCTESGYRFVVTDGMIMNRFEDHYAPHGITLDFTEYSSQYGDLAVIPHKILMKNLKNNDLLFDKQKLTSPHEILLNRNNYSLTELLVKKGAFADGVIDEAIKYAVEYRCYRSLDAISKTYTGGMNE